MIHTIAYFAFVYSLYLSRNYGLCLTLFWLKIYCRIVTLSYIRSLSP